MENKRVTYISLLLGICMMAGAEEALVKGEKTTISVNDVEVNASILALNKTQGNSSQIELVRETLQSQLGPALNATRLFQLVDRKRLDVSMEEQKLTELGQIDPNDKNAAKTGKGAAVKYVFLPIIDGFEDRSEVQEYQRIGRTAVNRKLILSCVVQIKDTTKNTILPDSASVMLMQQGVPEGNTELIILAKEMARQLCQKVVSLLRPAKVLDVMGKRIMINRGTEAGFNAGDVLEILAVREVTDEDTGEKFQNKVPVGQAKIVSSDPKESFATIEGEDMGVQKGCVVRAKLIPEAFTSPSQQKGLAPEVPQAEGDVPPGSSEKPVKFK